MFVRLTDIKAGNIFRVNDVQYIKLEECDNHVFALNKDPVASLEACNSGKVSLSSRAIAYIPTKIGKCFDQCEFIDVEQFARHKRIIAQYINDCWLIDWSNREQGKNGDVCYIDKNCNYQILRHGVDLQTINGNGMINIRMMCHFCPNTIVETED
jgi:hypothetical protein